MDRLFILIGSIAAFAGVGFGAFGAHTLKTRLGPELMAVFQTGVQYHLIHALGLFGVGLVLRVYPETVLFKLAGWLFLTGIVLFSGSLYLLAITEIRRLGMVTPFGGVSFLLGWACLAFGVYLARN